MFFFFRAENVIRVFGVTEVQTFALPIYRDTPSGPLRGVSGRDHGGQQLRAGGASLPLGGGPGAPPLPGRRATHAAAASGGACPVRGLGGSGPVAPEWARPLPARGGAACDVPPPVAGRS